MSAAHPIRPVTAVVDTVERLSLNFVRVVFSGPELAVIGSHEPAYDQRIKLIFPSESGQLPQLDGAESWYQAWLDVPEERRGSMRTYSVRHWDLQPDATSLTVDFVLHLVPGATGPASSWAAQASPGDEILLVAPWREGEHFGGIEFNPGEAGDIVLVGDETAAPAIARILGDLNAADTTRQGTAFIEVPGEDDIIDITVPDSFEVRWFPREGRAVGELVRPAVLAHAGVAAEDGAETLAQSGADLVWETPVYSATGEELLAQQEADAVDPARYYWIAGESGVVTGLRRTLTRERGVARSQVAFMGYWKEGVAMRG